MANIAAVGIGGTNFFYAAGTESGELHTEVFSEPTTPKRLVSQLGEAVSHLEETVSGSLDAVGVATRGMVDHERGVIDKIDVNNGALRRDVDLRTPIEAEFGVPLYLENDCTAATLAEYYFRNDLGHESIVHVTIGTGIGAGVIDDGRIVRGESGFAGEVGAIQVGPPDGLESFGIAGAWEAYCSGPGLLEYVKHRLETETRSTVLTDHEDLRPQSVFEVANDGDAVARAYLDQLSRYNAVGFGTIANTYNPGLITVGGGVARNNSDWVLSGLEEHLQDYLVVEAPEIAITEFGDDIGIYGALAQVAHAERNRPGEAPAVP